MVQSVTISPSAVSTVAWNVAVDNPDICMREAIALTNISVHTVLKFRSHISACTEHLLPMFRISLRVPSCNPFLPFLKIIV